MATGTRKIGKKDRTRDKLLRSAQDLILEMGSGPLTLNDITERAETAPGTFYNYYKTKEELIEAVVKLLLSAYHRDIDRITEGMTDPVDIFAASFRQTLHMGLKESDFGRMIFEQGLPLQDFAAGIRVRSIYDIEQGIAAGRFKVDNLKVYMSLIAGGVLGVLTDMYRGELELRDIDNICVINLKLLGLSQGAANDYGRRPLDFKPPPAPPISYIEYLK